MIGSITYWFNSKIILNPQVIRFQDSIGLGNSISILKINKIISAKISTEVQYFISITVQDR